jgi:hypothetical protein
MPRGRPPMRANAAASTASTQDDVTHSLQNLALQLQVVTDGLSLTNSALNDGLLATNNAVAEARASNVAIQNQMRSASSVQDYKKPGNGAQARFNTSVINQLTESLTCFEDGKPQEAKVFVKQGLKTLLQRNKHIRMADNSHMGWSTVEEYTLNEVADDEEDDRRMRRAEANAFTKQKRKQADSYYRGPNRGNFRGRFAGRGRGPWPYSIPEATVGSAWQYLPFNPASYPANVPAALGAAQPAQPAYAQAAPAPTPAHPAAGRQLGPCFVCQGPHLKNACPLLRQQQMMVQAQIEAQYKRQ